MMTSYVSLEIMLEGRPFFGLTARRLADYQISDNEGRESDMLRVERTIVVQVGDDVRERLLGLFVQVRDGDPGCENSIVLSIAVSAHDSECH